MEKEAKVWLFVAVVTMVTGNISNSGALEEDSEAILLN